MSWLFRRDVDINTDTRAGTIRPKKRTLLNAIPTRVPLNSARANERLSPLKVVDKG